jgi:hypothetical protein
MRLCTTIAKGVTLLKFREWRPVISAQVRPKDAAIIAAMCRDSIAVGPPVDNALCLRVILHRFPISLNDDTRLIRAVRTGVNQ